MFRCAVLLPAAGSNGEQQRQQLVLVKLQIFSSQPRLVKYAYLPNKRVVEGKLNHVIAQLEGLTQRVWEGQAEADAAVVE